MRRLLVPLVSASLVIAGSGCGSDDPEGEVRAFLAAAEAAAEARDTGFFRDAISLNYADSRGRQRDDVIDLIRGVFLTNSTVEIISRIETIELAGEDAATVKLQAALAGKREGASLLDVDGDLYGIELELANDGGDWLVIGADWER